MLHTLEGAYLTVRRFGGVTLSDPMPGAMTRFRFGCEPLLTLFPDGDQSRPLRWAAGGLHCFSRSRHSSVKALVPTAFALRPAE